MSNKTFHSILRDDVETDQTVVPQVLNVVDDVSGISVGSSTAVHVILGIDKNNNLVSAVKDSSYLEAFHGKPFSVTYSMLQQYPVSEMGIDHKHVLVYNATTQQFSPIPVEKYRQMKEL